MVFPHRCDLNIINSTSNISRMTGCLIVTESIDTVPKFARVFVFQVRCTSIRSHLVFVFLTKSQCHFKRSTRNPHHFKYVTKFWLACYEPVSVRIPGQVMFVSYIIIPTWYIMPTPVIGLPRGRTLIACCI